MSKGASGGRSSKNGDPAMTERSGPVVERATTVKAPGNGQSVPEFGSTLTPRTSIVCILRSTSNQ